MRRLAKSINFGIVYGMSDFGLAARTGLSQTEAARFISNYFAKYPKVEEYLKQTKAKARQDGYVETLLGRRRYFPELAASSRVNPNAKRAAERMAINMPIQGAAADIIKLAMIEMARMLQRDKLKSKMILQVHDELVFEIPADELEQMKARVREVMEGIYPLSVPLKVEMHSGHDWGHMG
jgi:DNA polymerase-1